MTEPQLKAATVAVIGGGLAGMAAGCALADAGFRVTIFERRPYLGGRASSYEHPGTGEVVDNCQHVLLGCCTNLLSFYKRIGVEQKIRWYERLTFIEPGGRQSNIAPSFLPAPLHNAPSFLSAACLDLSDKLAIARAMMSLMGRLPEDTGDSFLQWLQKHGQTPRAIERFWKPVLVSALNEELENIAVPYAALVFRESFLKSREAGRMGLPAVPLTELYRAAGEYISTRGGEVQLRAPVESFSPEDDRVKLCAAGKPASADFAVIALPFEAVPRILPDTAEAQPLRQAAQELRPSPITGVHLWFDRPVTDLDHAVLLERTIQWMFNKSKILGRTDDNYLELVVSASNTLVEKSRGDIVELAVGELAEFFPRVREAKLLKSTVIKEVNATYSPRPGADAYRPSAVSPWRRVFIAGDWTSTGWPATMEGAVRSGHRAVEALTQAAGVRGIQATVPDLPARGLMRFS